MDIIDMARASGLTIVLDGRIGREEYQSVCGSLSALQRFADAVRHCPAPFGIHRQAPRLGLGASGRDRARSLALRLPR